MNGFAGPIHNPLAVAGSWAVVQMHRGPALLTVSLLAGLLLAGCSGSVPGGFDPTAPVRETGNTIRLKMQVVDLFETELYPGPQTGEDTFAPGLKANLWAFCVEPLDANDAYSKAAISYFDPLPNDAPKLSEEQRKTCSVPGPTIRAKQGDRVIVEFAHPHFHAHTIHWHGQFVPNESDGVPGVTQEAVGGSAGIPSITYDFIAKRPGTLWYHCHVDTQLHVMQGLYGMFIVEPADQSREPKVDKEGVMVLSTVTRSIVESIPGVNPHAHGQGCLVSGVENCQNPPLDTTPDTFLVNGHAFPYTLQQKQSHWDLDEGQRLRLRILNAGNSVEVLHPHGQDMLVTHKDGLPLADPYYVDTLLIGPAERYDVVILGHNPGSWVFHTHVNNHEANDQQVPGGMHTMLSVGHGEGGDHASFPSELAGGFGYAQPVYIPQDHRDIRSYSFGAGALVPMVGTPATATLPFPFELPCSVRAVQVDAFLGSPAANLNNLVLDVKDAQGNLRGTLALGAPAPNQEPVTEAHFVYDELGDDGIQVRQAGNWTVELRGQAVSADVTIGVLVDHYGSFDEIKYKHRLDKNIKLCGQYGNGGNGLETKAPPP